jgi:methyltransferase family protein
MNAFRSVDKTLTALALLLTTSIVAAQQAGTATTPFEPHVGQPGKDVVWVPSPQALVDKMLDMAKLTPQDYLMDLGSGDGRTVITAAKRGATAVGVEYNPDMVALSKKAAEKEGVTGKASFIQADLFKTDLSKATVITMFLLPSINMQLRPTLLNLKPGTRVVSNTFTMEDWQPDETFSVPNPCVSWCTALLWIIPAKAQGTWKMPQGNLTLNQQFQMLTGTLGTTPISDGKVNGDEITFTAGGTKYTGKVNGNSIQGQGWAASRVN